MVNRGISGDRASDLYARWNEDAISVQPDLISILVGVNDAYHLIQGDARGASDRYRLAYTHLLEETRTVLPNAKIVLCEPFILRTGSLDEKWTAWETKMTAYRQIVQELADSYSATFVPLQHLFDEACERAPREHWLWDGIHPTAAGHEMIARQWLEVVSLPDLRG